MGNRGDQIMNLRQDIFYKVSFKAKASKKKYGYVAFGTDIVTDQATGAT